MVACWRQAPATAARAGTGQEAAPPSRLPRTLLKTNTLPRRRLLVTPGHGSSNISSCTRSSRGPPPRAAQQDAQRPGQQAQQEQQVEYKDTWTDITFIALCRIAYGNIAGWQSSRSWTQGPETFKGMVEVSRALMRGRSAQQQRDAVIQGFPEVPDWFRRVFPYSKWGAELNARITPAFFTWLVGPMQRVAADVGGQQQMSGVKIQRCRYLAESGCTAMCVNLCKAPTQTFFTEQLGMPLTMTPNFEDLSCEMVFGKRPPPLEEDPVATQPCLAACATAVAGSSRCHKLD